MENFLSQHDCFYAKKSFIKFCNLRKLIYVLYASRKLIPLHCEQSHFAWKSVGKNAKQVSAKQERDFKRDMRVARGGSREPRVARASEDDQKERRSLLLALLAARGFAYCTGPLAATHLCCVLLCALSHGFFSKRETARIVFVH